jgi:hypothetical protein
MELAMPRHETLGDIRRTVLMEVVPMCDQHNAQHRAKQARQIRDANRYIDQFFDVMLSDDYFITEQHAINSLAPTAVWIFGWVARRFAIMVIKALWRRWHE